ncbi:hypothetical protein FISHEDRAFT_28569, partial [Fistulina hepatica ATCC 64428]
IILAMHVKGHIDDCTYAFSSCYKECCGHFHSGMAEHLWLTLNQFCKVTRQMSLRGHNNTLVKFQNWWNKWK